MTNSSNKAATLANLPALDEDEQEDACFRARDRAWAALAGLFQHYRETEGFNYRQLGDRIGRRRAQVQRWLSSPFNMNLQSIGLLAEGMNADLRIEVVPRVTVVGTNQCHPSEEAKAWQETVAQRWTLNYQRTDAAAASAMSGPSPSWKQADVGH